MKYVLWKITIFVQVLIIWLMKRIPNYLAKVCGERLFWSIVLIISAYRHQNIRFRPIHQQTFFYF